MKLFIIGNGFDLNHGYPTKWRDFNEFVKHNRCSVGQSGFSLSQIFDIMENEVTDLWSDFEEGLSEITLQRLAEDCTCFVDEDSEHVFSQMAGYEDVINGVREGLHDSISIAINRWLWSVYKNNIHPNDAKNYFSRIFSNEDLYISFNYTTTLETVYGISNDRILHIHGKIERPQICNDHHNPMRLHDYEDIDIVYGHGESPDEIDRFLASDYRASSIAEYVGNNLLYDISSDFVKPYQYHCISNMDFSNVTEIQIIGHSLSSIDRGYFNRIAHQLSKDVTVVFWCIEPVSDEVRYYLKNLEHVSFLILREYPK